jgi:hypothetical protein
VELYGPERAGVPLGRCMAELPFGIPVEIEAEVAIDAENRQLGGREQDLFRCLDRAFVAWMSAASSFTR